MIALQGAFWARQYIVSPQTIYDFRPAARRNTATLNKMRREQWLGAYLWNVWNEKARAAYHLGLVLLLVSVASCSCPQDPAR